MPVVVTPLATTIVLKTSRKSLKSGIGIIFGNLSKKINTALVDLNSAQIAFDRNPTDENKGQMTCCLYEYFNLLKMEEIFGNKSLESVGLRMVISILDFSIRLL